MLFHFLTPLLSLFFLLYSSIHFSISSFFFLLNLGIYFLISFLFFFVFKLIASILFKVLAYTSLSLIISVLIFLVYKKAFSYESNAYKSLLTLTTAILFLSNLVIISISFLICLNLLNLLIKYQKSLLV